MTALKTLGSVVLQAVITAVFILGFATWMSRDDAELADRVDHGTAAIVCILSIDPELRTDAAIAACLEENDYTHAVLLPDGEAP